MLVEFHIPVKVVDPSSDPATQIDKVIVARIEGPDVPYCADQFATALLGVWSDVELRDPPSE